jgi:transposase InsO family protein
MVEYGIKFRPNKLGLPHLNGKVERLQRTNEKSPFQQLGLIFMSFKPRCFLISSITTTGNEHMTHSREKHQ